MCHKIKWLCYQKCAASQGVPALIAVAHSGQLPVAQLLAPAMSGKTLSAVTEANATRVKANTNPDFNKVLESRKNALILEYLNKIDGEEQKRHFQVSFSFSLDFICMYQDAVVHLTCNNDHETLESVLDWGRQQEEKTTERTHYGIEWKEPEESPEDGNQDEEKGLPAEANNPQSTKNEKRNPIMIASQQGFTVCTTLLFRYGYRIPQMTPSQLTEKQRVKLHARTRSDSLNEKKLKKLQDDKDEKRGSVPAKKRTEGDEEEFRFNKVVANPDLKQDQVKRLMLFKAYADPHYLSLALTEQQRLNDPDEMNEDGIWALQQLDPLRRAFDLAEKAEIFTSSIHGMSELKGDYKEIKHELETYTASLLTQCSDIDEVKMILEHNPKDEDEDEDDDEEQNWQKALLEGRKDFVGHPFYQQYFFRRLFGDTKGTRDQGPSIFQGFPGLEKIVWNLFHCPKVSVLHILSLYIILIKNLILAQNKSDKSNIPRQSFSSSPPCLWFSSTSSEMQTSSS